VAAALIKKREASEAAADGVVRSAKSLGLNLQFRAEAFNVLNHPTFSYPNEVLFQGNEYSPSGGVITATATTSRQIQFALKLLF